MLGVWVKPCKHAGSDSEAFWLRQLRPLRPACSQGRAGSCTPDSTSLIRFGPVLPKKTRIMSCKTFPDPIWVAWAGFGPTDLARKQAGVTVIIIDCFFIYRYSLLSGRLTAFMSHVILNEKLFFYGALFNMHSSGVLTALFGWCHVNLVPCRCTFCVHHTTMHPFTVSLRCIMSGDCVCSCIHMITQKTKRSKRSKQKTFKGRVDKAVT